MDLTLNKQACWYLNTVGILQKALRYFTDEWTGLQHRATLLWRRKWSLYLFILKKFLLGYTHETGVS
jgi:hypothetical protein